MRVGFRSVFQTGGFGSGHRRVHLHLINGTGLKSARIKVASEASLGTVLSNRSVTSSVVHRLPRSTSTTTRRFDFNHVPVESPKRCAYEDFLLYGTQFRYPKWPKLEDLEGRSVRAIRHEVLGTGATPPPQSSSRRVHEVTNPKVQDRCRGYCLRKTAHRGKAEEWISAAHKMAVTVASA
jgi:hypothetical protein